ncbi:uncharacterized protein LOC135475207 [Liolophura sinensis]|uniref:uncharacterized protein LOC135475207 n=1 Tax=Liolophura sinensis TaxID=3198878 RepID=UPI0031590B96
MADSDGTPQPLVKNRDVVVVGDCRPTSGENETSGSITVIDDILRRLAEAEHIGDIDLHLRRLNTSCNKCKPGEQEKAKRWLKWAKQREHLKVVSTPVPLRILPEPYTGELSDVRVFTRRGPDDAIFEKNKDIREKVARGNCFLDLSGGPERCMCCVVYAFKKFTGGLGDDDDKEKGDNFTWKKFFTKSLEETDKVVCTRKANGEAAHLSCLEIDGELFICGGSKNVHMLIRRKEDIELYSGPRFKIAKEVCEAIMTALEAMNEEDKLRLLKFLAITRFTAIFEILSPAHQHVENLSHLSSSKLVFITWTSVDLEPSADTQLSPLPPHVSIEVARCLGLETVKYEVIPYSDVEDRMSQVRRGYNYEGEVFYFLDGSSNVIGLLKKKTAWYILCRAIREKARGITGILVKSPETFSLPGALSKVERRLTEIQDWLGLEETYISKWKELGVRFTKWVVRKMENGELGPADIADQFPVTWDSFLKESGLTDNIQFGDGVSL